MSYTIQIIRPGDNQEHAPPHDMPERYDTIDEAIRVADTEIQMIGVPGAVTYRILDHAGQPVPVPMPSSY